MSQAFEIPLSPVGRSFTIDLANTTYNLTVRWNGVAEIWTLDIADQAGNAVLFGIPLVTGCDLLEQFGYLDIGGQLYAQTDHDPNTPPGMTNLGITGRLFFVTP